MSLRAVLLTTGSNKPLQCRRLCYASFWILMTMTCSLSVATAPSPVPLSQLCDDASAATCTVSGQRTLSVASLPCNQDAAACVPIYEFVMNTSLLVTGSLSCEQSGMFKACGIQINTTFPVTIQAKASVKVSTCKRKPADNRHTQWFAGFIYFFLQLRSRYILVNLNCFWGSCFNGWHG